MIDFSIDRAPGERSSEGSKRKLWGRKNCVAIFPCSECNNLFDSVYINRSGPGKVEVCAATKYTRPRQTISGVLAEGGGIVMGTTLTDGSLTHG